MAASTSFLVLPLLTASTAGAEPIVETQSVELESLPADLPLPASPPLQAAWLREANVLQPYGRSAFVFLTDEARPARLKREFGFNVVIVQPTDSHNTIARPEDQLTDEQFRAGLKRCREAGYRVLLYTSVMALGLSPEFQSGEIARQHPDWLQRDAKGNHIMVWGVPWLCPNTAARERALERCLRIVREYDVDGIMLDNNQFYLAAAGWTCHCDACTREFRDYVQDRFGMERALQLFGAAPGELTIPNDEGPLHALWLHWRNRVWAGINESFRARLRAANPNVMLFANTQYKFDDALLASDLQYEREDVVLSESVGLNSRQMSEKMVLGHALAAGRPLFNYIGTFAKFDDYTGMLPADTVRPMIAATLAHSARPWIVDGFDEGPTDATSRQAMAKLLLWHANHQDLFDNKRWSTVATIVSPVSRNVLHRPLIPPHLTELQSIGVPVTALRDDTLSAEQLTPFHTVTVETAACLSHKAAAALAEWVKSGGTLIAAREVGSHDEIGRKLDTSPLWRALEVDGAPNDQIEIGRGKVIMPDAGGFAVAAAELCGPFSFFASQDGVAEVVAYRAAKSLQLHVIRHKQTAHELILRLPESLPPLASSATLFLPDTDSTQSLNLETMNGDMQLTLANLPLYCVVEIPLR